MASACLLTLDLATKTGWTVGPEDERQFAYGVERLPSTGTDVGGYLKAYRDWLLNMSKLYKFDSCVFEQPVLPRQTRIETLRKLYGLCGVTELFCVSYEIAVSEASVPAIKKYMGVKRTGPQGKLDMIHACERLGYEPEDDNVADAIGLRLYTLQIKAPDLMRQWRMDMGPLGASAA